MLRRARVGSSREPSASAVAPGSTSPSNRVRSVVGRAARPVRPTGPLRVLFVVPDLTFGGAERHVLTLMPRLDPARFIPSLVCIGGEGEMFHYLPGTGIEATVLHRRKREMLGALRDLVRLMRRQRPDIVVTRAFNAEALGRLAGVLARVPRLTVWVHNCGDLAPRGALRRISDTLLRPVTAAVYGVAHGQLSYLTEELGHRPEVVRIVHNGTDLTEAPTPPTRAQLRARAAELGLDPEAPIVGISAGLRPEKDHATLLRAMRRVVDELPDAQLLVLGDGPLEAELRALTTHLGLADHVVFAGGRHDVERLLPVLTVFALSSFTVEAFPMALLEAMAARLPAVCTDVGGIAEMITEGETGHIVPARDPAALAHGLLSVLGDRDHAAMMGRAARARVAREFTLERSVAEAQRVLEETAGRANQGGQARGRAAPAADRAGGAWVGVAGSPLPGPKHDLAVGGARPTAGGGHGEGAQ